MSTWPAPRAPCTSRAQPYRLAHEAAERLVLAPAQLMELAQGAVGLRIAVIDRAAVPSRRLVIALFDGFAVLKHHTDVVFRLGVSLIRGQAVPFKRGARIPVHALSLGVHDAEIDLGLDRAIVGKRNPFLEGNMIVARTVSDDAPLEIRLSIVCRFIQPCQHVLNVALN